MSATIKQARFRRDYSVILEKAAPTSGDHDGAMRRAVSLLWDAFEAQGVSWVGFYLKALDADEMVLVCREPKPACSPIGLQGMCGRCWKERRSIVIEDVRTLGGNYIACDPRDQSEIVVPMLDADGTCRGVLDADSYDTNAFDEHDAEQMTRLLVKLGLTVEPRAGVMRL